MLTERDFPLPTDRELRQEMEAELRKLTREEDCQRIAAIEAAKITRVKEAMAIGINGRSAPNCTKSIQDHRQAERPRQSKAAPTATNTTPARKGSSAGTGAADTDRIIVSVAPNPKKAGSASFDRYAKYVPGMTVAEALSAGVTKGDIAWDSQRGFIKFEGEE